MKMSHINKRIKERYYARMRLNKRLGKIKKEVLLNIISINKRNKLKIRRAKYVGRGHLEGKRQATLFHLRAECRCVGRRKDASEEFKTAGELVCVKRACHTKTKAFGETGDERCSGRPGDEGFVKIEGGSGEIVRATRSDKRGVKEAFDGGLRRVWPKAKRVRPAVKKIEVWDPGKII